MTVGADEDVCQLSQKAGSAARHTYDVGYSKWDAFDVEAALQEVDRCDSYHSCRVSKVDLKAVENARESIDRSADPKDMLDQAISRLKAQEVQESMPAKKAADEVTAAEVKENAAIDDETDLSNICLADAGDTTGHQLAAEYQKWEEFEDMDDLEEGGMDCVDSMGMDLNALTGPAEEVKQIQAHWRREAVKMAKSSRKAGAKGAAGAAGDANGSSANSTRVAVEVRPKVDTQHFTPTGPVQERPCVVAPAAGRFDDNYAKWKKFDADAALLELDNEDTTEEGKTMRLSAGQGSAMLNCEGYTKDREEYDLDQDIERNMGGLKKIIAQNFKDASGLKAEGNELMRSGQVAGAIQKYQAGLDTLHLAREASVLMSASLAAKQSSLVADLYKNLSAAQLKSNDFTAALSSADAAIQACDDEKARYRRAMALLRLKRIPEARTEAEALAAGDPAVQTLLAEVAACS